MKRVDRKVLGSKRDKGCKRIWPEAGRTRINMNALKIAKAGA
jgi:hypothetical protein